MTATDSSAAIKFDDDTDDDMEDDMEDVSPGTFGYALNARHYIRFVRREPMILVSFEVVAGDEPLSERMPRLNDLAIDMGWSTLTLTSRGNTWFRDAEVINFFDAMVDGTLLDEFESALFYGQGSGGHGALSYALATPGARILALSPQVALGTPDAPEDDRFDAAGVDFTSRYAPSPENLSIADVVYVPFDPMVPEDRAHVARLDSPATVPLACRNMGSTMETSLTELGLLEELVVVAMDGEVDPVEFYAALREARRDDPPYLRRLIGSLIAKERPVLEALAVRNVARRTGRQRFAKRFKQIEAELAAKGIAIPAPRRT